MLSVSGNVSLCPSSIVQYAKQDGEILTQMGHSCYTVVLHKFSWPHAEKECNLRGGHLFHVKDSGENLFIYILLNTHFNHSVWMGLSDLNKEEHFEWTSSKIIDKLNLVSYTWNITTKSENSSTTWVGQMTPKIKNNNILLVYKLLRQFMCMHVWIKLPSMSFLSETFVVLANRVFN